MAKNQKPKNTSKGGNPTGSTDSSTSSRSVASKAADLVANSPSTSKTNDLPGDSVSPANTVTVVLQNHSGSDFPQTPEDLVNPNSEIVATNSIVPAQEGLIQRVDESTLPLPLSTGKLPEDTGNQEHDRHNTEDCPRSNNGPPRASGPKSKPKVQAPLIADPPAPFEIEPQTKL
ncbi:hypothetical protein F2Q70_00010025 [Brassica cretica]|uniref:Uncharacterized protein n=1 Tax=Brassica cretica TaxID=69181 RepID=A0A8S9M935_BRACR|nr:hypothetical protein F2Q70_00010025 [Brassica cretica]